MIPNRGHGEKFAEEKKKKANSTNRVGYNRRERSIAFSNFDSIENNYINIYAHIWVHDVKIYECRARSIPLPVRSKSPSIGLIKYYRRVILLNRVRSNECPCINAAFRPSPRCDALWKIQLFAASVAAYLQKEMRAGLNAD